MYDPRDLYEDPLLTGFAERYESQELFGMRIFPAVSVGVQSARYPVWNRANWLIFPSRREPLTVANEIRGGRWSFDYFKTVEHSLQAPIADEERQVIAGLGSINGEGIGLNPERDATEMVTRSLLLEHELKVATMVRNTANYAAGFTVTNAGATQWNDWTGGATSTSDPISQIRTAVRKITFANGMRKPNRMIIPEGGLEFIENHPRVVERFKEFSLTDPNAWKRLTGYDGEVIVANSVYNAAQNVDAMEDIQSFWGQDVLIYIADEARSVLDKTFGKTFQYPYEGGQVKPTDRWREEARKADLVRVSWRYDVRMTSNKSGYLIKNAFSDPALM
jgi:hypothetical protein